MREYSAVFAALENSLVLMYDGNAARSAALPLNWRGESDENSTENYKLLLHTHTV